MNRHSINIIRLTLLLLFLATVVHAQKNYRTSELKRLATVVSLPEDSIRNGYNHPVTGNLQLTVYCQANTIEHIGLYLFADEMRSLSKSPVFDFLERYFLQLRFPPTMKTARNMLRDDQFKFLIGSINTVSELQLTDAFTLDFDKNRYVATWSRDDQKILSVTFPVEYELISGENKIEAENNLQADIQRTVIKNDAEDGSRLFSHYISKDITSRLYYKNDSLVSDSRHPAETLANIMLSLKAPGDYSIRMTQVSYGFRKDVFEVPLRQWITFCRESGCKLYFGIDNISADGTVNAVVFAVNESENYNHVLTVSASPQLLASRSGAVEAHLYSYVPTHNVMSLFGKYRKSNPKTFVRK